MYVFHLAGAWCSCIASFPFSHFMNAYILFMLIFYVLMGAQIDNKSD